MIDFSLERAESGLVCGVDEAGRGPWAGPVVAAAVIWPTAAYNNVPNALNDSKKMTARARDEVFQHIRNHCLYGIGQANVEEIDNLNILAATKLAMQRAVNALPVPPEFALIDGNQPPELACPSRGVVKGDATSVSIAAASVVAKVTRDRIMRVLGMVYPHYGWANNAGYGTAEHQAALAEHGITEHHRKSFAPIKNLTKLSA